MAQLTVIAKFKAKPGHEDRVHQELLKMVAPSHQDEGVIDYDVLTSNDDPSVFFTYENWTGKDALDKHMQTPHFKNLDQEFKELLAMPMEVNLLTLASPSGA